MKSNIRTKIKKNRRSISNFVIHTTSFKKQEIDFKIARFIIIINVIVIGAYHLH